MKINFLVIVILILPTICCGQRNSNQRFRPDFNKSFTTKKDVFMYTCQFVSGCADGVNQAVIHHELGRGIRFWDYANSWKNKYRDFDKGDKRAAFFGSTTFAVGLTDGFHLTRLTDRAFTLGSLAFALGEKQSVKSIVKKVVICALTNRAGFLLFFNVIYPGAR